VEKKALPKKNREDRCFVLDGGEQNTAGKEGNWIHTGSPKGGSGSNSAPLITHRNEDQRRSDGLSWWKEVYLEEIALAKDCAFATIKIETPHRQKWEVGQERNQKAAQERLFGKKKVSRSSAKS